MFFSLNDFARSLRVTGAGLSGLGLALAGCATHEYLSEIPWMPNSITPSNVAIVSLVLFSIGAIVFAVSWSVRALQWIARLSHRALLTIRAMATDYQLLEMQATDLPDIYPVYRSVFGTELIPQTTVESWMAKNPRIGWKVVRVSAKRSSVRQHLVGFFEILPLTKAGEEKLRRDLPNTASITKNDIHSAVRWSSARAYYVASVGVMDPEGIRKTRRRLTEWAKSEGIVTKMLFETLRKLGARGRIEVYARPVTKDGLRLVRDYGFAQRQIHLPPEKAIWSREMDNTSTIERDRSQNKPRESTSMLA